MRLRWGYLDTSDQDARLGQSGHISLVVQGSNLQCCEGAWPYSQQPRRGGGRGLSSLLQNYPYPPSGMGRSRSRDPGPHPFPDPSLRIPNMWQQCLCGNTPNFPIAPSSPPAENPSGPPSLESIMSSESPESGYEANLDEN